jgi:hypothetical protein
LTEQEGFGLLYQFTTEERRALESPQGAAFLLLELSKKKINQPYPSLLAR